MKSKIVLTKRTLIFLVSVLCVLIIGAGVLTFAYAPKAKGVKYIAHRGFSENDSLKNTESAFVQAGSMSYYGIETDIRITLDGEIVCSHDSEVEFADGTILDIANSTLAELTEKKLKDADSYLCTFRRYLQICKKFQKNAIIELKSTFNATQIGKVFFIIDTVYSRNNVSFISFDLSNLQNCRALEPQVDCHYLVKTADQIQVAIDNEMNIGIYWKLLNRKIVKSLHSRGLTVNVWTVNNRFVRTYCDTLKVDYITSDKFS
ncbi:MAG TPA: glycerophosphodiester phosphodiesterase family protein [Clostridia bacterium]|nr:glycerophosphodiester phosphodiesterase family protein [Clostridia bacterium]